VPLGPMDMLLVAGQGHTTGTTQGPALTSTMPAIGSTLVLV